MPECLSLSPSINNHQLTVILVLALPPPHFVQGTGEGGRRRCFKGELGHHTVLLQYFVLMAVVQLFTFCLLIVLSLITEIVLGLCPDGVIKVDSSVKHCS